jgi:hypothetical protein
LDDKDVTPPSDLQIKPLHGFAVKKHKADDFRDELVGQFDKTLLQRLLVQWIANANLSFRLSEHGGLHRMLEYTLILWFERPQPISHTKLFGQGS